MAQAFEKITFVKHIVFGTASALLFSACMTSKREEELEQKISQLRIDMGYEMARIRETTLGSVRSSTEDVSRKAQGARTDVEDVRRQLLLTQGALDELQTKFSRFTSAAKTGSTTNDEVVIRISEIEYALDKLDRRMERIQAREELFASATNKTKLSAKLDTPEKLEKALSTAFSAKDYKKTQSMASQVLLVSSGPVLEELALRYRAEAHFANQEYSSAALDFSEFVDRFPRNSKYPRALLLAGDSYVYLRKFRLARSFYTECTRMAPEKEECKVSKDRLAKLPSE